MNRLKRVRRFGLRAAALGAKAILFLSCGALISGSWSRQLIGAPLDGHEHGLIRKVFVDDEGRNHQYVVFVPHSTPTQGRPPVILYLNGFGKNGDDGIAPLLDGLAPAIWPRQRDFPFVVIWPQCPKGGSWVNDGVSAKRAISILRDVVDAYAADADRVYLAGISSGGSGVWSMAAAYPNLFAAIAPVSAPIPDRVQLHQVIEAKIPVWSFLVQEDEVNLIQRNRQMHQRLLDAGVDARYTEVSSGHRPEINTHDAWGFAFQDAALYRWFLSQRRSERSHSEKSLTLVDPKSFPAAIQGDGGEPFGASVPTAILSRSQLGELAEMRLEFRASAGIDRAGVGWFGAISGAGRAGTILELPLQVTGASGIVSWPDLKCTTSVLPTGANGYLKGQWNDLAIRFERNRVSAELNGWPLLDHVSIADPCATAMIGVVVQGPSDQGVEIRNLRYRTNGASRVQESESSESAPPDSPNLAADVPSELLSLDAVASAWKLWEEQNVSCRIDWRQDRSGIYGVSVFRSDSPPVKGGGDNERHSMEFTNSRVRYTAAWAHLRADVTRNAGINGVPSLQDFLRVLDSNFERVDAFGNQGAKLEVTIDAESRADQVYQLDGTGKVGIVFDSCDPWKKRVDNLDDLFWRAPLLAFRPHLLLAHEFERGEWHLSSANTCVGRTNCHLLEQVVSDNEHRYVRQFWVNPAQEFLIHRFALWVDGLLREQIELSYSLHQGRCQLDSWDVVSRKAPAIVTSERYFPGNELLFEAARAIDVQRTEGAPSDAAISDVTFRQGCVIYDQNTKQWLQQTERQHQRELSSDEVMELNVNGRRAQGYRIPFHAGLACTGVFLLVVWSGGRYWGSRGRCRKLLSTTKELAGGAMPST